MPGKYPPNTYGAYLEDLAERIHRNVQEIGQMYQDPNFMEEFSKSHTEEPPAIEDWDRTRISVGRNLCIMQLAQKMMNDEGLHLDDPTPPIHRGQEYTWQDKLRHDAENEYVKFQHLFYPEMFQNARQFLHLDGKNPPEPGELLNSYNEMVGARQKALTTAKEMKAAAAEERKAPAKALLDNLKKSEQKSFYGAIKSFFVGNSKEYDAALKAVEGLADGTGDPKKAKQAIEQYLDLRGNKVRDHQFGRDRFDAMMKSLALVSTPREFIEYCEKTEQARFDRAKGAYKDVIDVSKYLSPEEIAKGKEQMKQQDVERINTDSYMYDMYGSNDTGRFAYDLMSLKNEKGFDAKLRDSLKQYMEAHPAVREAARDFVEKNGLKFRVPALPEGLNGQDMAKMRDIDNKLRDNLHLPQKEHQRAEDMYVPNRGRFDEPRRDEPRRPSRGPEV